MRKKLTLALVLESVAFLTATAFRPRAVGYPAPGACREESDFFSVNLTVDWSASKVKDWSLPFRQHLGS